LGASARAAAQKRVKVQPRAAPRPTPQTRHLPSPQPTHSLVILSRAPSLFLALPLYHGRPPPTAQARKRPQEPPRERRQERQCVLEVSGVRSRRPLLSALRTRFLDREARRPPRQRPRQRLVTARRWKPPPVVVPVQNGVPTEVLRTAAREPIGRQMEIGHSTTVQVTWEVRQPTRWCIGRAQGVLSGLHALVGADTVDAGDVV